MNARGPSSAFPAADSGRGRGGRGGRCDGDLRRDLHDRLGPVLAALALRVGTIRDHLDREDAAHTATARDLVATLEDDLTEAIADVRQILHDSRDRADGPDLSACLAARVRLFIQARGREWITLDVSGPVDALPRPTQRAVQLVVAEALTNVVRHSGAAECVVEVRRDATGLSVRVADDGMHRGPAGVPGMGVASMRTRIARLGGELTVRARPGGGTEVVAHIPAAALECGG